MAQRRLMQRICPPGASIMAVGDARQAIYAFRGATMYNLLSFADHFPATAEAPVQSSPKPVPAPGEGQEPPASAEAAPLPLSTNFRSGPGSWPWRTR